MINYYLDANIKIKKISNYDKLIKNFSLSYDRKYIKVSYMCGKEETFLYSKEIYEVLELVQQHQFERTQEELYPKLNCRCISVA